MPDPEDVPGTTKRIVKRGTPPEATEQVSQIVVERLATAKFAAAEHRRHVELEKLAHDHQTEREDAILRRRKEWPPFGQSWSSGPSSAWHAPWFSSCRGRRPS
jgi:hypothetical protein